jgi:hypothetical protein
MKISRAPRAKAQICSLKEYISSVADDELSEGVGRTQTSTQIPPLQMILQRKQLLKLYDGRWVAVYRDVKTGLEIVFPSAL